MEWRIERHEELSSTQDRLAERIAQEADPDGLVVVARRQRAGRGRRGRPWVSPEGGLWCSFCRILPGPPEPLLGLILALAAREAVAAAEPRVARYIGLKWPNDLITDAGEKWGGVLVETAIHPHGTCYRFGVGLDLAVPAGGLPRPVAGDLRATSILELCGHSPAADELLFPLLGAFARLLDLLARDPALLHHHLRSHCLTLGREIEWREGESRGGRGQAIDLDRHGALRVRPTGSDPQASRQEEFWLHAAEVRHVGEFP